MRIKSKKIVKVHKMILKSNHVNFIAHRGYSSVAPENTKGSFNLAGKVGFWGVECDIYETKDGHFVIMHDNKLGRMCGVNIEIKKLTLEQIKSYRINKFNKNSEYVSEEIPTLEEYLDICNTYGMVPIVEIKRKLRLQSIAKLLGILEEKKLRKKAYIISFEKSVLKKIRKLDEDIKLQWLMKKVYFWRIMTCKRYNFGIDCKYKEMTRGIVEKAHREGIEVNVWTVNSIAHAYKLAKDWKVDYITTNRRLYQKIR